jgi:predicted GIY-YIG superfamily endonuclease
MATDIPHGPFDKYAAVYRFYAADETLLYVGATDNVMKRLIAHKARHGRWFKAIAWIKVDHFDTRMEALAAEEIAITTENPQHNILKSNGHKSRKDREPGLEVAIMIAGGMAKLAELVNVERPTVVLWRRIPAKHVPKIARALNISMHELRPDIFPGVPR